MLKDSVASPRKRKGKGILLCSLVDMVWGQLYFYRAKNHSASFVGEVGDCPFCASRNVHPSLQGYAGHWLKVTQKSKSYHSCRTGLTDWADRIPKDPIVLGNPWSRVSSDFNQAVIWWVFDYEAEAVTVSLEAVLLQWPKAGAIEPHPVKQPCPSDWKEFSLLLTENVNVSVRDGKILISCFGSNHLMLNYPTMFCTPLILTLSRRLNH